MKRLLCSLFLIVSLVAGVGIAAAAVKATGFSTARILLNTPKGTVMLTHASGIGFVSKGSTGVGTPAPFDVRFPIEPQSEGLSRALGFLAGKAPAPVDATLQLLDASYNVQQQLGLGSTSIVELELPGANAAAKTSLEFRLRLQPSQLTVQAGTGTAKVTSTKTSKLLASNFRVSLDGVADPFVVAVSPAVVRRSANGLQISGLGVTIPLAQGLSGDWWKWAQNVDSNKALKIEYLDASLKTALLTVEFPAVSLESMEIDELSAATEQVAQVSYRLSASSVLIK